MKTLISILVLFSSSLFAESYTFEEIEAMHNDILLTCDDDTFDNNNHLWVGIQNKGLFEFQLSNSSKLTILNKISS